MNYKEMLGEYSFNMFNQGFWSNSDLEELSDFFSPSSIEDRILLALANQVIYEYLKKLWTHKKV